MLKSFLKGILIKTSGPRLQHAVRKYYLTRQILNNQSFREPEMELLKNLVMPGDCIADIGANAGGYTKEFSFLAGSEGHVYSFEPVPETYDVLQNVVVKARLDNVKVMRIALGAQSKQETIVIPELGGFTGYYWARFSQPGDKGRSVTVLVKTLDKVIQEQGIQHLHFAKCDVEGSELDVLLGSAAVIQQFKPAWLIEVSKETSADVFNLLIRKSCYRAYVYEKRLIEVKAYRDKEHSNYFFLHPDSAIWDRAQSLIEVR